MTILHFSNKVRISRTRAVTSNASVRGDDKSGWPGQRPAAFTTEKALSALGQLGQETGCQIEEISVISFTQGTLGLAEHRTNWNCSLLLPGSFLSQGPFQHMTSTRTSETSLYSSASVYYLLALINRLKYKQWATFLSRKRGKKERGCWWMWG